MTNTPATEERVWAVLSHLSALVMGMGIVLPVVGWSEQRTKSKYASFQCLQALGYQSLGYTVWILFTLLVVVFASVTAVVGIVNVEDPGAKIASVLITHTALVFVLFGIYFALPIMGAVACAFGKDFRYPLMGKRLAYYLNYESSQLNEDHADRWVVAMGHFAVIIMLWGMLVPLTAWIMQGKRSLFLKFQSIQTLAFQICLTLLFFGGMVLYVVGAIALLGVVGLSEDAIFNTSAGLSVLVAFFVLIFIVLIIMLTVPLFHIMGQWAGYRVLKGDEYRYQIVGRLVDRWSKPASYESLLPQRSQRK